MQPAQAEPQCRLQASDAVGSVVELHFLLMHGVGRVVGSDHVHYAVQDGLDHGVAVGRRAQRRIHLGVGVVHAHVLVGEQEVVRSNLAGHAQPIAAGLAHGVQRGGRGGVGHVQVGADLAQLRDQPNVALHHAGFGLRRHSPQPQLEGDRPQIHAGALRQPRVFRMLDDGQTHARRSGQGLAHHAVFQNGVAVVAHSHSAGGLHGRIVVDGLALRSAGGGGDGKDANGRAALRRLHPAGDLRRVVHRDGVGHGRNRGKSARRGSRRARCDGLLVALAGFAQVDVHVDEAGRHGQAGCVKNFDAVSLFQLARTGDFGHAAVLEQNVLEGVHADRRVDEMAA